MSKIPTKDPVSTITTSCPATSNDDDHHHSHLKLKINPNPSTNHNNTDGNTATTDHIPPLPPFSPFCSHSALPLSLSVFADTFHSFLRALAFNFLCPCLRGFTSMPPYSLPPRGSGQGRKVMTSTSFFFCPFCTRLSAPTALQQRRMICSA